MAINDLSKQLYVDVKEKKGVGGESEAPLREGEGLHYPKNLLWEGGEIHNTVPPTAKSSGGP